jgi:hypothetical protein
MEDAILQLEKQVKALTIQVRDLKEELRRNDKLTSHTTQHTNHISPPPSTTFRTGDRIRITNKIKRPANWDADASPWDRSKSAAATVTSVTATRIYFTNDNGLATWRLHKHVQHE